MLLWCTKYSHHWGSHFREIRGLDGSSFQGPLLMAVENLFFWGGIEDLTSIGDMNYWDI